MNDDFLNEMRDAPRPAFARALRERLRGLDAARERRSWLWRPLPIFATAALAIVVAAPLAFPSVRNAAQAFLDLFRVRTVTAIQFDPARLDRLHAQFKDQDPGMLVFRDKQMVREPGKPQTFETAQAAASATGLPVRTPRSLPAGLTLDRVDVTGDGQMRFSLDPARLRTVLDLMDLSDVQVPSGLEGKSFDVHMPRMVHLRYASAKRRVDVMQAESPEVKLPPGLDLASLGEVGLRVLGMDATEANRLASSIDWSSTLVVPIPITASSFRQVTVHGQKGLLITSRSEAGKDSRQEQSLLWSEDGHLYALTGNVSDQELVQLAESVQ